MDSMLSAGRDFFLVFPKRSRTSVTERASAVMRWLAYLLRNAAYSVPRPIAQKMPKNGINTHSGKSPSTALPDRNANRNPPLTMAVMAHQIIPKNKKKPNFPLAGICQTVVPGTSARRVIFVFTGGWSARPENTSAGTFAAHSPAEALIPQVPQAITSPDCAGTWPGFAPHEGHASSPLAARALKLADSI